MNTQDRTDGLLVHDVLVMLASFGGAFMLVKTGILTSVLASAQGVQFLGSFISGLFFTSVFTTAPAIVALGQIAQIHSVVQTALFGALGAVIGDVVIFRFVRDNFADHVIELIQHRRVGKRIGVFFSRRLFRWLSFFVGGLIIASPLPDELGISLFGFSKIKLSWFIPLSFLFNFVGILLIGLVARAV
ncbi:MAG: hypothetical protein WAV50_03165 [Minisyncoccia bacterium]